ncbi:glycosyltransferase family 4 protein [Aquabacterium sp.]|uniref:glycosyltransferase family 4 protein n=1 Tax=Aquabacterium sp. TaxID=1872578 RepID=UPI0025BC0B91|nr:glycosyltransferase family 4 protein [Aquabacterium sp.]
MSATMHNEVSRVLIVHNRYQQRGGEDAVVESESAMLAEHGLDVRSLIVSNDEIDVRNKALVAIETLWSSRQARRMEQMLVEHRPDVVHVHNSFPLLSPAVYWACQRLGVPVVQTLHNFRLACPQAMFLREHRVCEECLGHVPWRAVVHRCYRDSTLQSLVSATNITVHRALGTYRNKVNRFIALNAFCRDKFIEMGLPATKVVIKPNCVAAVAEPCWEGRNGGLYVGRLSPEKGMVTLLGAWDLLSTPGSPAKLRVVGKGEFEDAWSQRGNEVYLGFKPLPEVIEQMRRSLYMVVPSIWFENFPRTIVEAFSVGLPVIASRIGALAELIEDGVTGLLVEPHDPRDLANKMAWAEAHPDAMLAMGRQAHARYRACYAPDVNLAELLAIYRGVQAR